MCTFLGASVELTAADVEPDVITGAQIVYLEGYLFDPPEARRAFAKAAGLARASGRTIALTLSDFVRGRAPSVGLARIHRDRSRPAVRPTRPRSPPCSKSPPSRKRRRPCRA
ncbi:MAG: hypothetical protein WDM85_10125 [Caulobacteraceae bacterium]